MTKKTTITIEIKSLMVLRTESSRNRSCSRCGAEVEIIPVEDLGSVSNLARSVIERLLNGGGLHRPAGADGSLSICLNSLLGLLMGGKSAGRGLAQANKEMK